MSYISPHVAVSAWLYAKRKEHVMCGQQFRPEKYNNRVSLMGTVVSCDIVWIHKYSITFYSYTIYRTVQNTGATRGVTYFMQSGVQVTGRIPILG